MPTEPPLEQAGYAQQQRAHERNRAWLGHGGGGEIWAEIGRLRARAVYRVSQSSTRNISIGMRPRNHRAEKVGGSKSAPGPDEIDGEACPSAGGDE